MATDMFTFWEVGEGDDFYFFLVELVLGGRKGQFGLVVTGGVIVALIWR